MKAISLKELRQQTYKYIQMRPEDRYVRMVDEFLRTYPFKREHQSLSIIQNGVGSFSLINDSLKPNVVFATFYKRRDAEMVLELLNRKECSSADEIEELAKLYEATSARSYEECVGIAKTIIRLGYAKLPMEDV